MSAFVVNSRDGWWTVDFASYVLSQLRFLEGLPPSTIDIDDAIGWIRSAEFSWCPGSVDLHSEAWLEFTTLSDSAELVDRLLLVAAGEIGNSNSESIALAGRTRLPVSTLRAFASGSTVDSTASNAETAVADTHVHQGACLPVEVVLHWLARKLVPDGVIEYKQSDLLRDTGGVRYHPLPLLLCLRVVLDNGDVHQALRLCAQATLGDLEAWELLEALVDRSRAIAEDVRPPSQSELTQLKMVARTQWLPARREALFRLEAILMGSVTQRVAGLDTFVVLFEGFASMRRRRLPKEKYYFEAIRNHCELNPTLQGLELRLGELIYGKANSGIKAMAGEYAAALQGYADYSHDKDRPLKVTFPFGFVKTGFREQRGTHWRADPSRLYSLTESILDLTDAVPAVADFMDGVDVCGNEEDCDNWLFRLPFERMSGEFLRRRRTFSVRFHAGEWQFNPVNGLRHIDEVLRFDLPAFPALRIGHALALSDHQWGRLRAQPLADILDDLVWAWRKAIELHMKNDSIRMIERACLEVGRACHPHAAGLTSKLLAEAYLSRGTRATLTRIGFLSPETVLSFADQRPPPVLTPGDQLIVDRLATGPLEEVHSRSLSKAAGSGLIALAVEDVQRSLSLVYEELAASVREEMMWRGIIVETCPTSNILAGGVAGYARHPAGSFVSDGVRVTVSSDDPSLFHSAVNEEIDALRRAGVFTDRQIAFSQRLALSLVSSSLSTTDIRLSLESAVEKVREFS